MSTVLNPGTPTVPDFAKYVSIDHLTSRYGRSYVDSLLSHAHQSAGALLPASNLIAGPDGTPTSNGPADRLATTLDSLFARNPWQWTYCVTHQFNKAFGVPWALKYLKWTMNDVSTRLHACLWVLQVRPDTLTATTLCVPGFDCHLGTDVETWAPGRNATPEQKFDALSPWLRREVHHWMRLPTHYIIDIGPIYDVQALRNELVASLFPAHQEQRWDCSELIRRGSSRFPCVTPEERRAAWNLEKELEIAKRYRVRDPVVWGRPHYPSPTTPIHPRRVAPRIKK